MYKYSKGSLPDGFNNFFTTRSEIHDYHTRYKDHYHHTRNARTFSDHSIRTLGPILWNSLDNNVRKSNSINTRKISTKQYYCVSIIRFLEQWSALCICKFIACLSVSASVSR